MTRVGLGRDRGDAAAADLAARALDRLGQRGDEPARVDRVVAGDVEREPHGRRERGLGAARLARAQPLAPRARASAGTRSAGRAPRPRRRRGRRRACPCGGGPGRGRRPPPARRRTPRRRRRCAARARAARARRTPPRRPARASRRRRATRPGSPESSTTVRRPRWRGAPGAREADRPAADDGDVVRLRCGHCWLPSLRRYDPDQVRRSAARCRPLSPSRAPVVDGPF